MPGKKYRSIATGRRDVYEALKRRGFTKSKAAKIANAGKTKAGRKKMARKAARNRKR
jgi:hypothetical protein